MNIKKRIIFLEDSNKSIIVSEVSKGRPSLRFGIHVSKNMGFASLYLDMYKSDQKFYLYRYSEPKFLVLNLQDRAIWKG